MRGLLWLALWLQLLVSVTSATPPNEQCVTAVYTAYGYIGFAGFPAKGFWNTRCQNALEVTSIYAACEVYCSPAERTAGLVGLAAYCREYAGVDLIPREQLAENLTEDAIHRMRIVEYRELPKKGAVDDPVLISEAFYQVTFRTLVSAAPVNHGGRQDPLIINVHRMLGNSRPGPIMLTGALYPERMGNIV